MSECNVGKSHNILPDKMPWHSFTISLKKIIISSKILNEIIGKSVIQSVLYL